MKIFVYAGKVSGLKRALKEQGALLTYVLYQHYGR